MRLLHSIADLPGFSKKTAMLISEFWRFPLVPKGVPSFKNAKFAIAWKKKVTRVSWFFH